MFQAVMLPQFMQTAIDFTLKEISLLQLNFISQILPGVSHSLVLALELVWKGGAMPNFEMAVFQSNFAKKTTKFSQVPETI